MKITEQIISKVIYGMENQKEHLCLDPSDGLLKPKSLGGDDFISLPKWGPRDGYALMEAFTGSLPVSELRAELEDVLASGHGVFRGFKDVLRAYPEEEQRWRRYKHREMRLRALEWLGLWVEAKDLEGLGPEPEVWEELTRSDFVLRCAGEDDWKSIWRWFEEEGLGGGAVAGEMDAEAQVAETPLGDLAGAVCWKTFSVSGDSPVSSEKAKSASIFMVYVRDDFRRLGLGRYLLETAVSHLNGAGITDVFVNTPDMKMAEWLGKMGFKTSAVLWRFENRPE